MQSTYILLPGHDRLNAARDIWWKTRNASKALDALGRQNCIERQLLTGLKTYNQNDLVSAINNVNINYKSNTIFNNVYLNIRMYKSSEPIHGNCLRATKMQLFTPYI